MPRHWSSAMSSDRRAQTEVCATGGRSKDRPVHWELLPDFDRRAQAECLCHDIGFEMAQPSGRPLGWRMSSADQKIASR